MDNNPGSTSAQGSSRQGSTSRGVDLSLYPVEENLTPPRPNDKVVLEKCGLSITDVFIGNAQTKLYRGLSIIAEQGSYPLTKWVPFTQVMAAFNNRYPDHMFTTEDESKIRLLIVEKRIYNGNKPYDKLFLGNVIAAYKNGDTKNIKMLSD